MWLWKILDYRESSTLVNRKRKIKTLCSQQCRLRGFFGFFFSLHKFHNLLKKEQIFNLLPLSMLLEIVKIISGNITVHATFVGCVFGKILANESHLVKRRLPNL